eukprot:CAMPEP_0119178868 /NCGR_PEP_ID=MMETSP1315-20130426/52587_1 /TAXON_ID=676789 /ORGANISM="Prasinoderma singularis, Strain RCC927" /LENGTH=80 /DNA_ID=CAMNT_0007173071 /DNA_START=118 /DNA_END=360 /DNA_ORIENTATION=+
MAGALVSSADTSTNCSVVPQASAASTSRQVPTLSTRCAEALLGEPRDAAPAPVPVVTCTPITHTTADAPPTAARYRSWKR